MELLEDTLLKWVKDVSVLEDSDVEVPNKEILQLAIDFFMVLSKSSISTPQNIMPDGDGGIIFTRRDGDLQVDYEIESGGSIDMIVYKGFDSINRTSLV